MQKLISFVLTLSLLSGALFAYDDDYSVDENLLSSVPEMDFTDYMGEWMKRETIQEVRSIGTQLSMGTDEDNVWSRFFLKYSVIHITSEDEPTLRGADIFSIDPNAKVNDIFNVRLILSAYLETEYGYDSATAWLLAKYITYYNAYYRGDLEHFSTYYKTVVLDELTAENAGLSTLYSDWPGKTKIVMPLTTYEGDLPDIDTSQMTDEDMQDDVPFDERQEYIELQESELEDLKDERDDLQQEMDDSEDEQEKDELQEQIDEMDEDIENREELIDEQKEDLQEDIEDDELANDPDAALEETRERNEDLDEREAELNERESDLEEREEAVEETEDRLRDELIDDAIYGDMFYFMQINNYYDGGYYNNHMYKINPGTLEVEVSSPYTSISGSEYDIASSGVLVIGYEGQSMNNHRLVLLDLDTLEMIDMSEDYVFHRSFVEIYDDEVYVVSTLGGKYYLAKYDLSLNRLARSEVTIASDTYISFYGDYVYVKNSGGSGILALNREDLSEYGSITP